MYLRPQFVWLFLLVPPTAYGRTHYSIEGRFPFSKIRLKTRSMILPDTSFSLSMEIGNEVWSLFCKKNIGFQTFTLKTSVMWLQNGRREVQTSLPKSWKSRPPWLNHGWPTEMEWKSPFLWLLNGSFIRSDIRFHFDKLSSHFVVGALRQNAENCPASFIHVAAFPQRQPAGTRTLQHESNRCFCYRVSFLTWLHFLYLGCYCYCTCSTMSFSCMTATPTSLSSRAKQ